LKTLIGDRIKSARLLAGYSLRGLSIALNGRMSHTTISKFEKGELMPDSNVLVAISNVLQLTTDYFFRAKIVDVSQIEFRKKSTLSAKKTHVIKERIKDSIERYLELESFFNFQNSFKNPIREIEIGNYDDLENAVELLLQKWGLGINALPNVFEMLEDQDIKVVEIDADEKFDGLSGWVNGNIPLVVVNINSHVERKRFTALRELGHLLLNIDRCRFAQNEIEKFCNMFAGAMLIPRETIFKEMGRKRSSVSLNELIGIKESYGISIQAIMARAKDLEIITNDQYVRFRIWVNRHEDHKWEIGFGDYKGVEHSTRFKQLVYRATAEEIISMSKAASLSNVKLAQFREDFMAI
jgi:Zn-dependent peptidase ImmA (M78 family)/DNA-binding XRE family transcriptional regulator